ncbi:MAG TPA: M36 family metallopeptidase [Thermoanaerobaculia bacterium]
MPLSAWERRPAQVYSSDDRGALTMPSTASPDVAVSQFLTSRGHDAATARSAAAGTESRGRIATAAAGRVADPATGLIHVRADQRVNGLVVYGSYIKAALNEQGQIVHLIENLAPVTDVVPAAIDEESALGVAIGRLHPHAAAPRLMDREGSKVRFERADFFYAPPTVTRVLASMEDGSLHEAFLVETWTMRKNLLHHTLVSGKGEVLNVELRTSNDQYFVYLEGPDKESAQTLVSGPAPVSPAGTTPSPNGWLTAGVTQKTINITGNNVKAYLDTNANNQPDTGGTTISNGAFTTVHSRTTAPSTTGNRAVAVQNLFYLNNRIHDILYAAGFNESEANFQENNFSRGGVGSDSVNAEAQDGSGLDNANFATPAEGQNPRMQMYLWAGKPTHQVVLGSTIYGASGAGFGPALTTTGRTGALTVATPADGCTAISTTLTGRIAIIDRGNCDFVVKVKNAQLKGAVGVIVANHAAGGDSLMTMGGTDNTITIPSVFVGQTAGIALKAAAGSSSTIRLSNPAPLQRDGDLDSDIVYHEYGHGLTWRMIGSMSGPLSGAIGEGMGDVLAIVLNGDDRVGEYSSSNPTGIRSAPYTNHPRTYGTVTGANGVHYDGEVYAAIGWKLRELYLAGGLTETDLLRDLVQGMRFTPAAPSYQQMRDGILAATATNDCKVWTAFALYGVGQGATSTVSGSTATVTESFTVPAGVCP